MRATEPNVPEAVKGIIATLMAARKALTALAPEYNWSGLGSLLGDFGEYIAVRNYHLLKAPSGSEGFDAVTSDGKKVQVKAVHASSQIGFRGKADLMLVISIDELGNWDEIYFGDFEPVLQNARYAARDNKYMIAVTKLKTLNPGGKTKAANA
jgi:hypothetical protein